MEVETDKYALFSKAFAELSEESQNKLVDMAHRLLYTHQLIRRVGNERITLYPPDLPRTNISPKVMVRMGC